MNREPSKNTVLITGASRGIGKAIAELFAKVGYSLFLCCRTNIDGLSKYSEELSERYNISCLAIGCDVGNEESVENMFHIMETSGMNLPQVVVNNAGIAHYGLITDMSSQDWHELMNVNLDSVFHISKRIIPHMLKSGGGRIINISSVWGEVGASCEVAYSASKGAVNAFTKALAKELAPSNIQVNAISCGMVNTEMNTSHLSSEEIADIAADIPADRVCEPSEIAEAVLMLANSPSYLTGQIITVDGGWI